MSDDPTLATAVAADPQLGKDVFVHSVEFRPDGTIDITLSERQGMADKAAITKLVSLSPDLLPDGELGDVIDTIADWADLAWQHIRGA